MGLSNRSIGDTVVGSTNRKLAVAIMGSFLIGWLVWPLSFSVYFGGAAVINNRLEQAALYADFIAGLATIYLLIVTTYLIYLQIQ